MDSQSATIPGSLIDTVARVERMPGTRVSLRAGDLVVLNSGGPLLLVVDVATDCVTASMADGTEIALPRPCFSLIAYASSCEEREAFAPFA